ADQALHELEQVLRESGAQHDVAGKNEERDRQQDEAVEAGIDRLGDLGRRGELEYEDGEQARQPERKADWKADGEQQEQRSNEGQRHDQASTLATGFSGRMPASRRMSRRLIAAKPIGMTSCGTQTGKGRLEWAKAKPNSADSLTYR